MSNQKPRLPAVPFNPIHRSVQSGMFIKPLKF